MSRFAPTSTPRVGSSAMSTAGWASRARANMSFCWLPPDRAAGDGLELARRGDPGAARPSRGSTPCRRRTKPNRPSDRRLARLTFSRTGRAQHQPVVLARLGDHRDVRRGASPSGVPASARGPGGHLAGGRRATAPKIARASSERPAPTRPGEGHDLARPGPRATRRRRRRRSRSRTVSAERRVRRPASCFGG